jgi:hypothetical protein
VILLERNPTEAWPAATLGTWLKVEGLSEPRRQCMDKAGACVYRAGAVPRADAITVE